MSSLTAEQTAELRRLIARHGLGRVGDRIEAAARGAIALRATRAGGARSPGTSRFGGVPDLPPDLPWPSAGEGEEDEGGAQYPLFLAQINLAELPPVPESPLPDRGLLYFFVYDDQEACSLWHKVLYHPGGGELRPTPPPEGGRVVRPFSQRRDALAPYRVSARPAISTPSYGTKPFKGLGLNEGGEDLTDDYFLLQEELRRGGGPRGGQSQMLGYPYMTDTDFLSKRGEEWVLLFQMDSDQRVGISWWDAGLLHVLVPRNNLEARRFDRTYAGIYTS